jgi:acyl carrier protein
VRAAVAGGDRAAASALALDAVVAELSGLLGESPEAGRGGTRPFKELGLDSAMAVELRTRLARTLGLALPATVVFDHASPAALAEHLVARLGGGASPSRAVRPHAAGRAEDDPVAIVGTACRYPGGIASAADLWRVVEEGVDAVGPFPADRGWTAADVARSTAREGGFLDDVAGFDAAFFGISPREARAMDPQQRLLLESAWQAFEHAGIDPASLRGSDTGVFAGALDQGYGGRLHEAPESVAGHALTGTTGSVLSGRVAYRSGSRGRR